MKASIEVKKVKLKTWQTGKPNEAPYFIEKKQYQGACGKVYPLPVTDQISSETADQEYEMVCMENDFISVHLLPAIGGKIYGAKDKGTGYEFIYKNEVIKPALIGLCGPWVSGGVEFNWPQHHRPTTYSSVKYEIRRNEDGSVTCFMGEAEPFHRMRGTAAVTVYSDRNYIEVKAMVSNTADQALPFMWWNNTAVRVDETYRACFPPDISYGADHDRRAIISFPVMKGVFETARPFDYGEGTDASWFKNVKIPTSVMIPRGETEMDFLGGYDYGRDAGTVICADHFIAPGKKMFTWGNGEFGKKWCANLTDNEDRYIELMTGAYTDNQPDFTYIEPGETKEFTQRWYPISHLGGVSNANPEAAVYLEKRSDGRLHIGAAVTTRHGYARLCLTQEGKLLWEREGELTPHGCWTDCMDAPEVLEGLCLTLTEENGKELISWQIRKKTNKQAPEPRKIMPPPEEIKSLEFLYLAGRHLQQYKHGTYSGEDYYREALRRDEGDYRCNLEMGKLEIEKGRFEHAYSFFTKALKRITWKNVNPQDTEAYYQMGRLLVLMGKEKEAYGYFEAAAWQYPYRSAALFACGCIDCIWGDITKAAGKFREVLKVNAGHRAAKTLLGYLTGEVALLDQLLEECPIDTTAALTRWLMCSKEDREREASKALFEDPQEVLDAALLFKKAGLLKEALSLLEHCEQLPLDLQFHLKALSGREPEEKKMEFCFPNRLEDISVLKDGDWRAQYMLGCLYYDRDNWEAAAACWEKSLQEGGEKRAYTWRNLAFAYFDHLGKREYAMKYMEKAVELKPEDPRLVYELMQLQKVEKIPVLKRLETVQRYKKQVFQRDDAWVDAIILQIQSEEYEKAKEMLNSRDFHIYEGGEGKLTKYHRWLYVLSAYDRLLQADVKGAAKELASALIYPKNYGEGKGFLEQDANVHYIAGLICERDGRMQDAYQEYEKVRTEPMLVNEILFFTGLCLEKLGNRQEAERVYEKLLDKGEDLAQNPDRYGYFGVGMEAPLPFESDIIRKNRTQACLYRMLGYFGLNRMAEAEQQKQQLLELEPDYPLAVFLEQLEIL